MPTRRSGIDQLDRSTSVADVLAQGNLNVSHARYNGIGGRVPKQADFLRTICVSNNRNTCRSRTVYVKQGIANHYALGASNSEG
jgi:hypothetical protein